MIIIVSSSFNHKFGQYKKSLREMFLLRTQNMLL